MNTRTKKINVFKLLAVMLVMALAVTCFTAVASASQLFPYYITNANAVLYSYGSSFNTSSDSNLTVASRSMVNYGDSSTYTVILQKQYGLGWITIASQSGILADANSHATFVDLTVPTNTNLRMGVCFDGTGSEWTDISMGVSLS